MDLGVLLYEMTSLYPSLTRLYRAGSKTLKNFPRLPTGYSDSMKELIKQLCMEDVSRRPSMNEVLKFVHEYTEKEKTAERFMLRTVMEEIRIEKTEREVQFKKQSNQLKVRN